MTMGDRNLRNKKPENGAQQGFAVSQVSSPKLKGRNDSPAILYERVNTLETMISNVLSNQADIMKKLDNLLSEKNKKDDEEAAQKVLTGTICETWKELQDKRYDAFTKYNRNVELATLYAEWQSETPDYLPKKFRPIKIRGNNSKIAEIRMNEAKSSFQAEIKMLKVHADTQLERLNVVNEQAEELIIKSSEDDKCRDTLNKKWDKECRNAEEKIRRKWISKRDFFIKRREEDLANGVPMEKEKDHPKKTSSNMEKDDNIPVENTTKKSPRQKTKEPHPKPDPRNNQQKERKNSEPLKKPDNEKNSKTGPGPKNKGGWKQKNKNNAGSNNEESKKAIPPQTYQNNVAPPQATPFFQAPHPYLPYPPFPSLIKPPW